MTATALTSLSSKDGLKLCLQLCSSQRGIVSITAVDDHAVSICPAGVGIVGGVVSESSEGSTADISDILVAASASMAVVAECHDSGHQKKKKTEEGSHFLCCLLPGRDKLLQSACLLELLKILRGLISEGIFNLC